LIRRCLIAHAPLQWVLHTPSVTTLSEQCGFNRVLGPKTVLDHAAQQPREYRTDLDDVRHDRLIVRNASVDDLEPEIVKPLDVP